MLLSIIVPVYNTNPKILKRCFRAFSELSEKYELIVVNDGSNNRETNQYLETIKANKSYKVIEQENRGVSAARNRGMDESTGSWIMFCDADDEVELTVLEHTLEAMVHYEGDFIYSDYWKRVNGGDRKVNLAECSSNREYTVNLLRQPNLYGTVWGKLFKRSVIKDIKFDEALTHSEDAVFLLEFMSKASKVLHSADAYYRYYISAESASKQNDDAVRQYIKAMDAANGIIENQFPELTKYVYDFCNTNLLIMLVNYIFSGPNSYKKGKEILDQISHNILIQKSLTNNDLVSLENRVVINFIKNKYYLLCFLAVKIRSLTK